MNKYDSDEIVHIKNGDLEYIQFKVLNDYNVKNCITLRHGGLSKGEYESLNFRTAGNDDIENVLGNLDIVKKELNFGIVCKGMQKHTDKVIIINDDNCMEYEFKNLNETPVDGYITDKAGIATLITTADCNPIIIYDCKKNIIANIHAGWKGVINKIYINAINIMKEKYNSKAEDLIICIGPSIRKCCFTSKEEEFKHKFTDVFKYEEDYLYYDKDNITFHIDLIKILQREFEKVGVNKENIHIANICTKCNNEDFFSYREAKQQGMVDYATMATIVEISEKNVK